MPPSYISYHFPVLLWNKIAFPNGEYFYKQNQIKPERKQQPFLVVAVGTGPEGIRSVSLTHFESY